MKSFWKLFTCLESFHERTMQLMSQAGRTILWLAAPASFALSVLSLLVQKRKEEGRGGVGGSEMEREEIHNVRSTAN